MENIKKQTKYCTRILYGDNDSEEIRKKYFSTNIQLERVQNRTFFDLLKIFIQRTKNKLKIKTTLAKDRL